MERQTLTLRIVEYRIPGTNLKLVSTTRISVLTANKDEYEAVILDLLGVD
jgi:hypothetical protein